MKSLTFYTINKSQSCRSMSFTFELIKQHSKIPTQLEKCHVSAQRWELSSMFDCRKSPNSIQRYILNDCIYRDLTIAFKNHQHFHTFILSLKEHCEFDIEYIMSVCWQCWEAACNKIPLCDQKFVLKCRLSHAFTSAYSDTCARDALWAQNLSSLPIKEFLALNCVLH